MSEGSWVAKFIGFLLGCWASGFSVLPWYIGGLLGLYLGHVFDGFRTSAMDQESPIAATSTDNDADSLPSVVNSANAAKKISDDGQQQSISSIDLTKATVNKITEPVDLDAIEIEPALNELSQAFFDATFTVLGHIAKADGHVSDSEIAWAKIVMRRMNLKGVQQDKALELFNRGKQTDIDLIPLINRFKEAIGDRSALANLFVDIQLQAAFADDSIDPAEQATIDSICQILEIKEEQKLQITRRARVFSILRKNDGQLEQDNLDFANTILGVDFTDDDQLIRNAYRRLLNQYHPDKLISSGLPEAMSPLVVEQAQFVKAAYELIRAHRQSISE